MIEPIYWHDMGEHPVGLSISHNDIFVQNSTNVPAISDHAMVVTNVYMDIRIRTVYWYYAQRQSFTRTCD